MKRTHYALLSGIIFMLMSWSSVAAEPPTTCDDDATAVVRKGLLKGPKTASLYRATLSGDKKAALDLALEIGKTHPEYVKCVNRLGAENGDPTSQYNYSRWLLDSTDEATRSRGMYWLKRAAAAKHKIAKELLGEYQSGQRK